MQVDKKIINNNMLALKEQRATLSKGQRSESIKLFTMLLPCLAFIFIFRYLPLWGWSYSLFDYKPGISLFDCKYVGFDNFIRLFQNPVLRGQLFNSLRNTFAMAGLGLLCTPLAPIFAIMLNEVNSKKYKKLVQTATTLPHFISWIILYSIAFFMFSVNDGVVNKLLIQFGFLDQPINFLASKDNVWITMLLYSEWKSLGWGTIVYLATIAGIEKESYEAASIDGANRMQRIIYITVPGLIPTYFVLLVMSFGHFLDTGMEQYYVFQNAMNKEHIEVLDLYVYNQGIGSGQISYATAVGTMKSFVSIIMFSVANYLSKIIRGTSVF